MGGEPATVILVITIIAVCSVFQRSTTLVSASFEYNPILSFQSEMTKNILLGQPIHLVCKIKIRVDENLNMTWQAPPHLRNVLQSHKRIKIGALKVIPIEDVEDQEIVSQELIVERATMADDGKYRCLVQDIEKQLKYQNFTIHVHKPSEDYIMLLEEKNLNNINVRHNVNGITPPIDIAIEYRSYPANITYYWVNDTGSKISEGLQGKYELSHNDTHVKLRINDPTVYDTGNYSFIIMAGNARKTYRMSMNVFAKPIVQMESKFGKPNEEISFMCKSIGYPRPDISFAFVPCLSEPGTNCSMPPSASKNWDTSSGTGETLIANARTYNITPTEPGVVYCKATNIEGSEVTQADLLISDERTPFHTGTLLIYINLGLMVALIFGIVLVSMFYCKKKKEVNVIKETVVANFEEGNLDLYNPDLGLDEQADLLPYNAEYNFPKERLKLSKTLGSGVFGVVMKATATRIIENEEKTTVAVKMVKKATNYECWRALVSELKILVHLGKHLNVVNLLGAVTQNMAKCELMVIVEYCRFGNVKDFLRNHRPHFIDQINQETGKIDSSMNIDELRWSKCGSQYNNLKKQKQWCCNNGVEHVETAWSVITSDLVCWASQIACGMEYLASRNVLHGDLAARNILLCDDNVVKICDFGLARSMYKSGYYRKKGKARLPFKWLAPECISDLLFSTCSDVWAYGIVLWELFSLGMEPYPGMEANQELHNKLRRGYVMDKPQYSNQDIYDIMLSCWNKTPDSRPSFKDLKSRFNAMLPAEMQVHYLKLNEPYLQINAKGIERGRVDYLALLGSPEGSAPAAPNNVNTVIELHPPISQIHNDNGYLDMSGVKSVPENRPRIGSNPDSSSPKGSERHKKRSLPEEIPMLDRNRLSSEADGSNSDSETVAIIPKPSERKHKPERE